MDESRFVFGVSGTVNPRKPQNPQNPQNPRGNAVNIWYTITVEKMLQSDARTHSGFDRDILEWNIPEEDSF